MKSGRCLECRAWTDSYGIVHAECCSGGFHEGEEGCPCEGKGDQGGRRKKK